MTHDELIASATASRERAYAPYSSFKVGAALLGKSGRVYTGCNVENAAYGPSMCAERTAIFKAVSEGEREFRSIAVVTENGASPCGVCRQVMMEFAPDMTVIIADTRGNTRLTTVRDLLPDGFTPDQLARK
ncbi:MAG: cytidine deaminase [Anaerolineae bacterium]